MAIYLIRHGSAGKRSGSDDDSARPLDARGHEQAAAIADLLAEREIARVLSSPALRCQQTVAVLAARCGLDVEVEDWLAEGSHETKVLDRMRALSDRNVVLCSHGDVIPEVVRSLEERGMTIAGNRGWKKGAVWTIHMEGRIPATAEYLAIR